MNIYILIPTVVLIVLAYEFIPDLLNRSNLQEEKEEYLPFVKKQYLMSIAERKFYNVLKEVVGDKYEIVPQVVLSAIVEVEKYEKNHQIYRNKINRNVLDFVLFEKPYFVPYLVIELDDSSHELQERKERDIRVDAILKKAGIRIEHIKTTSTYNKDFLLNII